MVCEAIRSENVCFTRNFPTTTKRLFEGLDAVGVLFSHNYEQEQQDSTTTEDGVLRAFVDVCVGYPVLGLASGLEAFSREPPCDSVGALAVRQTP